MTAPAAPSIPAAPPAGSIVTTADPVLWTKRIGDDWLYGYTFLDATGAPIPLGGASGAVPQAQVYAPHRIEPLFTLALATAPIGSGACGIVLLDGSKATTLFKIGRDLTSAFAPGFADIGWPTRLAVQILDATGNLQTLRVDPQRTLHPRFEPLCPATAIPGTGNVDAQATADIVLPGPKGDSGDAGHVYPVVIGFKGQTAIPLPVPPLDRNSVKLFVNGVEYSLPPATATTAMWAGFDFDLEPTDTVELSYD